MNIPYPDVPIGAPGVPIVPVAPPDTPYPPNPASSFDNATLSSTSGPQDATTTASEWSLVDSKGNAVITPDSVVSFEYRGQQRVLNYPIEQGSFASYNKVAIPFDIHSIMSCGGNGEMTRDAFVKTLDEMLASTNLYSFVTPDRTYKNVNLVAVNYARLSRKGVTLIQAELWLEEIRETVAGTVTPAQPDGAAVASSGQVSPVPATASQVAAKGPIL